MLTLKKFFDYTMEDLFELQLSSYCSENLERHACKSDFIIVKFWRIFHSKPSQKDQCHFGYDPVYGIETWDAAAHLDF